MAKTVSHSADTKLYDDDFHLWVERQADRLRKGRFCDLDLAHLIDEVEDLGASVRNAVTGRTREIILHLLKLQFSPAVAPRAGWRESIGKQRDDLEIEITPSLERHLEAELENIFRKARRRAVEALAEDSVGPDQLPSTCPYTLPQIMDPVWYPANIRGIADATP